MGNFLVFLLRSCLTVLRRHLQKLQRLSAATETFELSDPGGPFILSAERGGTLQGCFSISEPLSSPSRWLAPAAAFPPGSRGRVWQSKAPGTQPPRGRNGALPAASLGKATEMGARGHATVTDAPLPALSPVAHVSAVVLSRSWTQTAAPVSAWVLHCFG